MKPKSKYGRTYGKKESKGEGLTIVKMDKNTKIAFESEWVNANELREAVKELKEKTLLEINEKLVDFSEDDAIEIRNSLWRLHDSIDEIFGEELTKDDLPITHCPLKEGEELTC